jgi:hypothetical protein
MLVVEAKVLSRGSREQARVAEHLQLRGLQVIRRDVVPRMPPAGRESSRHWVVPAAGETGKGLVWVGRSAHAQVQLEREGPPAVVLFTGHEEIDRERADHSGIRQLLRDPAGKGADCVGVRRIGRKAAPRESLPAATVKDLVVRRE